MEEVNIPDEEYETQFYGFAPSDLCEGVKSLIHDRFSSVMRKAHTEMSKIPESVISSEELKAGIERLNDSTMPSVGKTCSKLEQYLMKVMKIPPNVLLQKDVDQPSVPISKEATACLERDIDELRSKIKKEKYVTAALEKESKETDFTLQAQREHLSSNSANCLDEHKEAIKFILKYSQSLEQGKFAIQGKFSEALLDKLLYSLI